MARAKLGPAGLAKTLAAAAQPIYLLNSRRVLIYLNPAAAAWLNCDPVTLLGTRCDYHSQSAASAPQSIAAGLCPPPEAFAAHHSTGVVSSLQPDGRLERRMTEFIALPLAEEAEPALLAIVAEGAEAATAPPLASGAVEPTSAELHILLRWLRQTQGARGALDRWVGDAPAVRRVREQFQAAVAADQARVIVIGPRGSGRRELAKGIHYRNPSGGDRPLVPIHSALVDAEQLQAAVTSLARLKSGRAEAAASLLLIDADQLTSGAQQELAGFLQLPGFDLRTLATAQTSLLALAERGSFRRDLAYALSTLVIELPSLAARRADFPLLVQALIEEQNAAGGKQISGCASDALDRLAAYHWPGDVEQLAGVLRDACAAAQASQIALVDLPSWLRQAEQASAHPRRSEERIVLDEFLAEVERELLARALERAKGNKARAAKLLGISRPRLLRRMEQLGLAVTLPVPESETERGA